MASNQFLYKPTSEGDGNLVVLTPNAWAGNISNVELVDSQGNVVESGRYTGQHNEDRGHFRFSRPGGSYGGGMSVRTTMDDGSSYNVAIQDSGGRYEMNYDPNTMTPTTAGAGAPGASLVDTDGDGVGDAYMPQQVDYGAIQPAQVDFGEHMGMALQFGQLASQQYLQNIGEAAGPAMGVLGTDVAGLQYGISTLGQQSRMEGRQDLRENIQRANELDQFNFSRLEGINSFNRQMAEQANEFNMSQQQAAEEATGIGYRQRVNDLLDRMESRARTGRMGEEFDEAMDVATAARTSDLLGASGISAVSGAGVRARDRAMINERVNLALGAEGSFANTLMATQQMLQYQPERAPTAYAEPTQVPLNPASVEARMPITAGVSAGQAQMGIAGTMTQLGTIPAGNVLSAGLSTTQFNEQARYNQQLLAADRQQDYNNMAARVGQGVLNQDYAAQLRDEQYDAYQQGMEVRERADVMGTIGTVGGIAAGAYMLSGIGGEAAAPSGGASATSYQEPPTTINGQEVVGSADVGGSPGYQLADGSTVSAPATKSASMPVGGSATRSRGASGKSMTGNNAVDTVLNNPTDTGAQVNAAYQHTKSAVTNPGTMTVGNRSVSDTEYNQALANFRSLVEGTPQNYSSTPTGYSTPEAQAMTKGAGAAEPTTLGRLAEQAEAGFTRATSFVDDMAKPILDQGIDAQLMGDTVDTLSNWATMPSFQQLHSIGNITTQLMENRGVIDSDSAREIQEGIDAATTLMNPDSSTAQRAAALGTVTAELMTSSFTGDIDNPSTIGGMGVTQSIVDPNGNVSFRLEDGSVVEQGTLQNTSDILASAQALEVLTSDADTENKVGALLQIGIGPARAHDIITQTQAGYMDSALSIVNTAMNWDRMSPFQRGISLMNTGKHVFNIANNLGSSESITQGMNSVLDWGGSSLNAAGAEAAGAGAQATTGIGAEQVASGVGNVASILAGGYSAYKGFEQAADVFSAVDDMSQSQAQKYGGMGLAGAGAAIGGGLTGVAVGIGAAAGMAATGAAVGTAALPVIGTVIGAAVGLTAGVIAGTTGTGKNTGQLMRDGWRGAMTEAGFANKEEGGNVSVTLADGSKYDIGADGNAKLTNKDGTERNTYDIDWGNPAAADTIPDAHLMAIATGLDPTSAEGHGLFDRSVGQLVNAATSNADTVDGARNNYKSMMDKAGVNPVELGMRIETLRATNKITDQEYGVYIDRINQMFGTKLQPTGIDESRQKLVQMVEAKPADQRSEFDNQLYKDLTDKKSVSSSAAALDKRLRKGEAAKKGEKWYTAKQRKHLETLGAIPKQGESMRDFVPSIGPNISRERLQQVYGTRLG